MTVCFHLTQADLGDEFGEPVIPDRQIRIIDNPQHKYEGKKYHGYFSV